MGQKVNYQGLFLDAKSEARLRAMEGERLLKRSSTNLHVTFAYKPVELFPRDVLGTEHDIQVVGYGNNGCNSGFEVILAPALIPFYQGKPVVHITTSLCETGEPEDTAWLTFESIESFTVRGSLGYFLNGRVIYHPI